MTELRNEILNAIVNKDKERLKDLKLQLQKSQWLQKFGNSIPVEEWLKPNPFIRFVD